MIKYVKGVYGKQVIINNCTILQGCEHYKIYYVIKAEVGRAFYRNNGGLSFDNAAGQKKKLRQTKATVH